MRALLSRVHVLTSSQLPNIRHVSLRSIRGRAQTQEGARLAVRRVPTQGDLPLGLPQVRRMSPGPVLVSVLIYDWAYSLQINPKNIDVNVHPTKQEVSPLRDEPGPDVADRSRPLYPTRSTSSTRTRSLRLSVSVFRKCWRAQTRRERSIFRSVAMHPSSEYHLMRRSARLTRSSPRRSRAYCLVHRIPTLPGMSRTTRTVEERSDG